MDGADYEGLAGRLYGLLIMLEGRLGAKQARLLHHFIEVGEYDLALEEIAGAIAQDQIDRFWHPPSFPGTRLGWG